MNFNFKLPENTTSAFSLGTSTPATSGISFGLPSATTAVAPNATVPPGGFSFGAPTTSTTQNPLNFNFQSPGAPPAATTTSTLGINLSGGTTATGFTLGAVSKPATTGLTFTLPNTSAPQSTTSALPAFGTTGLAATTAATTNVPAPTTSTGFSLGIGTSAAASPGLLTGSTVSTTPLKAPPTTTTTTVATSVTTTAGATPTPSVNFVQLEENINKWTIELEEQEKVFMNQVSHINEWDRLLLANGDKIVSLNNNVEKVKLEQQQLDHELDFIVAQQRELEECLLPLEKEFANITVSDPERDTTYRMSENLNSQLRLMSEDLKEVIEHINEKNKNQDTSDPIVQIGKILNAHMNSLQWIDQSTTTIKQQLDQLTKLTEIHRRENESTQNL